MSWIAKNSVTGKTYGNEFECIYDCQSFIDTKLCILEYEMRRCFGLEEEIIYNLKEPSLTERISDAIKSFGVDSGLQEDMKVIVEFSLQGKKQKDIDEELHRLACARWQKNNIIRCWYVEQKRFADGFDF